MTTYISILRAINITGHNIIKMDTLRDLYKKLGCKNVSTYIQSGNVVFQGDEEVAFSKKAVYLYYPHGFGRSKLTNNLLEAKLKVGATTRNWRTTLKLLEMAEAM
jgi:uncharacterized protein (DUF1697 family)